MQTLSNTYCTKEKPDKEARWHNDSQEDGEDLGGLSDGGSYVRYKCPNCGFSWWQELPD